MTEEDCRRFAAQVLFAFRPDPALAVAVAALNEQVACSTAAMACSIGQMCAHATFPKFTIPALPPETLEALRSIAAHDSVAHHAFALAAAVRPPRVRIDVVIHAEGEM